MSSKFNDERVKQVLSTATVFEVTPQECHVEKYGRPCDTKRVKKMVKN